MTQLSQDEIIDKLIKESKMRYNTHQSVKERISELKNFANAVIESYVKYSKSDDNKLSENIDMSYNTRITEITNGLNETTYSLEYEVTEPRFPKSAKVWHTFGIYKTLEGADLARKKNLVKTVKILI